MNKKKGNKKMKEIRKPEQFFFCPNEFCREKISSHRNPEFCPKCCEDLKHAVLELFDCWKVLSDSTKVLICPNNTCKRKIRVLYIGPAECPYCHINLYECILDFAGFFALISDAIDLKANAVPLTYEEREFLFKMLCEHCETHFMDFYFADGFTEEDVYKICRKIAEKDPLIWGGRTCRGCNRWKLKKEMKRK